VLKGSNSVAFGFDEGLVVVKIGEPAHVWGESVFESNIVVWGGGLIEYVCVDAAVTASTGGGGLCLLRQGVFIKVTCWELQCYLHKGLTGLAMRCAPTHPPTRSLTDTCPWHHQVVRSLLRPWTPAA
jgi:hypothetical protein